MTNKRGGSGSGIFLMEMMVVVFFFMLCASTCILAFAKSDRMSRLAWERDHAVSAAQSVAEVWKLSGEDGTGNLQKGLPSGKTQTVSGETQQAEKQSAGLETQADSDLVYWNADLEETTDPSAAAYTGNLTETDQENGMHSFQIVIRENGERGEELFTLDAEKYIRRQD